MSIFDQVKAELGDGPAYVRRTDFTKYHGYANGKNIGTFDTKGEAIEAGAKTTEKVIDEDGFEVARDAYQAHQAKIMQIWKDRLRADNDDISNEVFDLVYDKAYDDGHSSGMSEVELQLDEGLDLARKILATVADQFAM
jgi:hypothetical protein